MAGKKITSGVVASWPKPDFAEAVKTHKNFRTNFHAALLYAHYEVSPTNLKKEVVKYLKSKDPKNSLLGRIDNIHENRFITVGKYMYILNHGAEVPDDIFPKLMPALEKVINEEEARSKVDEKAAREVSKEDTCAAISSDVVGSSKPTIQDRLKEKANEAAGEVEGWLDDFIMDKKIPLKTVEDFLGLFKTFDLKSAHMRFIVGAFKRRAAEVSAAAEGKDKYLMEAYSHLSKPELKKLLQFHLNLLKACDMMQEVAKVQRVPRKKKPISVEKVISKLKYKKEDNTLGIVSLNPAGILGSKEVWCYNTKTRKLSHYRALDERGILVKGASLLNYSPDSAEKTLRKPIEALAEFKKASKVKLRTFLKELTTVDIPCSGKLNEHHIILRIDK